MTCETCVHHRKTLIFHLCDKFKLAYPGIAALEFAGRQKGCERLMENDD